MSHEDAAGGDRIFAQKLCPAQSESYTEHFFWRTALERKKTETKKRKQEGELSQWPGVVLNLLVSKLEIRSRGYPKYRGNNNYARSVTFKAVVD